MIKILKWASSQRLDVDAIYLFGVIEISGLEFYTYRLRLNRMLWLWAKGMSS